MVLITVMCLTIAYAIVYVRDSMTIYDDYEPIVYQKNENLYNAIRNCILKHKKEIKIDPKININDMTDSIEIIYNNDPEIFWLKSEWTARYETNCTTIIFDFKYSEDKIDEMEKSLNFQVNKIIKIADAKEITSDIEKFKFIRQYIMDNTIYDELADRDPDLMAHTAYGCLVENIAVCDGYSKAFKLIANRMGLDAGVVIGASEPATDSIDHAWNYVKIDSDYFWTDITWDDIAYDKYGLDIYQFFRLTDEELSKTHTVARNCKLNEFIPVCSKYVLI